MFDSNHSVGYENTAQSHNLLSDSARRLAGGANAAEEVSLQDIISQLLSARTLGGRSQHQGAAEPSLKELPAASRRGDQSSDTNGGTINALLSEALVHFGDKFRGLPSMPVERPEKLEIEFDDIFKNTTDKVDTTAQLKTAAELLSEKSLKSLYDLIRTDAPWLVQELDKMRISAIFGGGALELQFERETVGQACPVTSFKRIVIDREGRIVKAELSVSGGARGTGEVLSELDPNQAMKDLKALIVRRLPKK